MDASVKAKRKKNSVLWNFYTSDNGKFATCVMCHRRISYKTTTSNLRKHLARKHQNLKVELSKPIVVGGNTIRKKKGFQDETALVEACDDQNRTLFTTDLRGISDTPVTALIQDDGHCVNSSLLSASRSASPDVSKDPLYFEGAKNIQVKPINTLKTGKPGIKLLSLFTKDFQPFQIVEDKGFREFFTSLNTDYKLPSKEQISKTAVPELYRRCQAVTKEMVKVGDIFCITIETWTATNSESYLSVTAHYINEQFQVNSSLLDCTSISFSRNSESFASEIKRIVCAYNIEDKIQFTVSENDNEIQNAVTNILGYEHFNCFADTINTIIREAVRSHDVSTVIEKLSTLVAYYKSNDDAYKKLIECQSDISNDTKVTLSQVCDTRYFYSIYIMLEKFLKLEAAIKVHAVLKGDGDDDNFPILTDDEWTITNQLFQALKPFESVIKMMSLEKYCPASIVIPLVSGLQNVCTSLLKKPFRATIKKVITDVQDGINNNLGNVESSATLSVCMFLDPRFKNIAFSSKSAAEHAKEMVIAALVSANEDKVINTSNSLTEEVVEEELTVWHVFDQAVADRDKQEQSSKKDKDDDEELSVWSSFDNTVANSRAKPTAKSLALAEIQRYLECEMLPRQKNPLLWWKEKKLVFPQLANLAKSQLCAVSTSVPCERLFTKSGLVLAERRSRLNARNTKMLVFLNANM